MESEHSPCLHLEPAEARVLACLMEKELATPDYYPMTLASLTAACNQKSNREPVMLLDEDTVEKTLDVLRYEKKLATLIREAGARVPKYRHEMDARFALSALEKALLAELMLRGPQTVAELRTRITRMVSVSSTEDVEQALNALKMVGGVPMVLQLPRSPGRREPRIAHQLCGPVLADSDMTSMPVVVPPPTPHGSLAEDVATLRQEVAQLRADLASLKTLLRPLLEEDTSPPS